MIKHAVVWKLKDPAQREAHAAAVKSALEGPRPCCRTSSP